MEGDERKFIDVMCNESHGGFSFSKEAKKLYCKNMNVSEADVNFRTISRTDPVMIQIVRDLGDRVNGESSNICLERIDAKYEKHFYIDEYDGYESVVISYDEYKLDEIRKIVERTDLSAEEKEVEVKKIVCFTECSK